MDHDNSDKTPQKVANANKNTPTKTPKNFTTRFLLLSHNIATSSALTPTRVVKNPFDHQLHEKLHLPVISR
jgi:hypothetical protein